MHIIALKLFSFDKNLINYGEKGWEHLIFYSSVYESKYGLKFDSMKVAEKTT